MIKRKKKEKEKIRKMLYVRINGIKYDCEKYKFMQNVEVEDNGKVMIFTADVLTGDWVKEAHYDLFEVSAKSGNVSYNDVATAREKLDCFLREAECRQRQGSKPYIDSVMDLDKYIETSISDSLFEGSMKTPAEAEREDKESKIARLKYPEKVTGLSGYDEGKKDYAEQIGDREVTTVIFPSQIQLISSSYVSGFFDAFAEKYGITHIKENVKIISENSERVRDKIIGDLY